MWADYDIVDLVDNYRYLYTMLLHFIFCFSRINLVVEEACVLNHYLFEHHPQLNV
jgi:hypothetical protein